ncbi:MAG: hypothetical protein AAFM92_12890 [Pseudomonadota bacterium]
MKIDTSHEPQLTFPDEELAFLKHHYGNARVILEYGSGGSTLYGARLPGRFIMSVESDEQWALNLQRWLDAEDLQGQGVIHFCDIGPTGMWGRPEGVAHWRKFYRYPSDIWSKTYFRDPDLVLVDGRFRAACFIATFLRIKKPTTVLFDDYVDRAAYHIVEKLARPAETRGRMALFRLEPGPRPMWVHDLFMEVLGDVALANADNFQYPAHNMGVYPLLADLKLS